MLNVSPDAIWLPTRLMAKRLSISRDTLNRMLSQGIFREGHHYRRANPTMPKSPRLWHRLRVEKALGAL